MKRHSLTAAAAILLATGASNAQDTQPGQSAASKTISTEQAAIVDGNTAFAVDLYQDLRGKKTGDNLFVSPASISTAFGLAYAGARGETAEEIARVLHFGGLSPDAFHPALGEVLSGLEVDFDGGDKIKARLSINNALWVDKQTVLEAPYIALTAEHYGAGDYRVDYRGNPDRARKKINTWVEDKTEDRIKNLLLDGSIDEDTRSILVNTIYMKANWAQPFIEEWTKEEDFQRLDGGKLDVPMMHQTDDFKHWQNNSVQLVEMPYVGDLSMVVLLPKEKTGLPALEEAMTNDALNGWLVNLAEAPSVEIDLKLPKVKLETKYFMVGADEILPDLGMRTALSDNADFSGAVRAERQPDGLALKIGEVVHQTFLEIDEAGTEAAAVTAIVNVAIASVAVGPTPPPPIPFYADHPYIFLIKDNKTGMILLLGRIMEPEL